MGSDCYSSSRRRKYGLEADEEIEHLREQVRRENRDRETETESERAREREREYATNCTIPSPTSMLPDIG